MGNNPPPNGLMNMPPPGNAPPPQYGAPMSKGPPQMGMMPSMQPPQYGQPPQPMSQYVGRSVTPQPFPNRPPFPDANNYGNPPPGSFPPNPIQNPLPPQAYPQPNLPPPLPPNNLNMKNDYGMGPRDELVVVNRTEFNELKRLLTPVPVSKGVFDDYNSAFPAPTANSFITTQPILASQVQNQGIFGIFPSPQIQYINPVQIQNGQLYSNGLINGNQIISQTITPPGAMSMAYTTPVISNGIFQTFPLTNQYPNIIQGNFLGQPSVISQGALLPQSYLINQGEAISYNQNFQPQYPTQMNVGITEPYSNIARYNQPIKGIAPKDLNSNPKSI